MARPLKEGLDYFPFDVDFFSDKKIKRVKFEYGASGIVVYQYIICEIYRNGYYVECDGDFILDISEYFNYSENKTKQIINYLIDRSLLQCILVNSVKVLTAKSVQRRYQVAKKGCHRDVTVDERFWLLEKEETETFIKVRLNEGFSENNHSKYEKNDNKSEKNSPKENKINKSKIKQNNGDDFHSPTDRRTYENISSSYRSATGRCLTDNDIEVINELREEGITDDVIITTIYEVSRKTTKKINSLRYFKQAIENKTGRSGFCYPSTYSTSDIEAVLDAEWKAECDAAGDIEYTYDD